MPEEVIAVDIDKSLFDMELQLRIARATEDGTDFQSIVEKAVSNFLSRGL